MPLLGGSGVEPVVGAFISAVEFAPDGHARLVRFDAAPELMATSVVDCAGKALDPAVHLVTDGLTRQPRRR